MKRVEVSGSAKADINRAANWYEGQKEELGDRFLSAVLDTIDRIALNPEGYTKAIKEPAKPKSKSSRTQSGFVSVTTLW